MNDTRVVQACDVLLLHPCMKDELVTVARLMCTSKSLQDVLRSGRADGAYDFCSNEWPWNNRTPRTKWLSKYARVLRTFELPYKNQNSFPLYC